MPVVTVIIFLYCQDKTQLPRIVLQPSQKYEVGLAVNVDSIADFLMVRGEKRTIEGTEFGNFRPENMAVI